MLVADIKGCTDCGSLSQIMCDIDTELYHLSRIREQNSKFDLGICVDNEKIEKLIRYKRILYRKYRNPDYMACCGLQLGDIISKIKTMLSNLFKVKVDKPKKKTTTSTTTTTTTASHTTSTTTSTTTTANPSTSTTTTSSTTGTTSSTTTTTSTLAPVTVYWGWKSTASILTQSQIQSSGFSNSIPSGASVVADYTGNPDPQYLWMAEPVGQPAKTKWFADIFNNGDIGGESNLFGTPVISGSYRFYITTFQTSNTSNPIEFKIS